ncbi:gliding motility protein GldN [bacterium]|nr:gliding motility protein GldN [bacterium]MDB4089438.1 gliding motility protein GldN [Flavobacteriales bacterium]
MKTKILGIAMMLIGSFAFGQLPSTGVSPSNVLDGLYIQTHIPTKKVVGYASLREADVMWSKRIWRTIDVQQKLNFPLFYPKEPLTDRMALWDIIKYGIETEGSLTPYLINGDGIKFDFDGEFLYPLLPPNGNTKDDAYITTMKELLYSTSQVAQLDEDGEPMFDDEGDDIYITSEDPVTASQIVKYYVKEDWFFDKQRSVMDVRIIGLSPVIIEYDDDGEAKGEKQLFWLYFPECRYVFQNYFVYNRKNDAQRMSFDDLFWKRMFASFIHKETNVYDREVSWYEKNGVKALLQSEKIKNEMLLIEHDLWHL